MSFTLVAVLAMALPGLQSPPPSPVLSSETAGKLVAGWSGLAASTGRKLVSVKAPGPSQMGLGIIEFQFVEGREPHTAVAFAAPSAFFARGGRTALSESGDWGLVQVFEDQTLDNVIESLARSRVLANESATLGNLRAILGAESVYSSQNGGFYDAPRCLVQEATCLPPGSSRGVAYLGDPSLAALGERSGYRYRFVPGPAVKPGPSAGLSPTSLKGFALTAVPVTPGQTGQLAFCADDLQHICAGFDGSEPGLLGGRCSFPCPALESARTGLNASTPAARHAAARALGHMADPGTADALASSLRTESVEDVRLAIMGALTTIGGPRARLALLETLTDANENVRIEASASLNRFPGELAPSERQQVLAALRPTVDRSKSNARAVATALLGTLGEPSDRARIEARLRDDDPEVRGIAARALKELDERVQAETPWAPPANAVRVAGTIKMPRVVSKVNPDYPEEARARGASGTVILEALIATTGRISAARIVRGVEGLDQAALRAVRQWTYEPTTVGGKTVPVIVTLTVTFKP